MRIIFPILGFLLFTCHDPEPQSSKIWRLDTFEAGPFCSFPIVYTDPTLIDAIFNSEGNIELIMTPTNKFTLQSETTSAHGTYQIFENDSMVFIVNGGVHPARIKTHTSDSLVFVFPEGDTFVNLKMVWVR